jgi:SAM-dependent methyltransferase
VTLFCGFFSDFFILLSWKQLHAISIAVIHHFSTVENRIHALREIHRVLKVGGEALVTVWAFEQVRSLFLLLDAPFQCHLMSRGLYRRVRGNMIRKML